MTVKAVTKDAHGLWWWVDGCWRDGQGVPHPMYENFRHRHFDVHLKRILNERKTYVSGNK